ncbi:hypothetical protein [Bacillus sp. PK5-004]
MAKIIAIQSIGGTSANFGIPAYPSLALGQTYEVATALATDLINKGFAIDYTTALTNPKCPKIIRTGPIVIN